jgi:hypothetical protein
MMDDGGGRKEDDNEAAAVHTANFTATKGPIRSARRLLACCLTLIRLTRLNLSTSKVQYFDILFQHAVLVGFDTFLSSYFILTCCALFVGFDPLLSILIYGILLPPPMNIDYLPGLPFRLF